MYTAAGHMYLPLFLHVAVPVWPDIRARHRQHRMLLCRHSLFLAQISYRHSRVDARLASSHYLYGIGSGQAFDNFLTILVFAKPLKHIGVYQDSQTYWFLPSPSSILVFTKPLKHIGVYQALAC